MLESLKDLFDQVPDVQCKGLCVGACGPVAMSAAEEALIVSKHGSIPSASDLDMSCSALRDGKCSIYAERPLVCRVFGAVREMRCPHGCTPKQGGLMPSRDARKLFKRAEAIRVVPLAVEALPSRQGDVKSVLANLGVKEA